LRSQAKEQMGEGAKGTAQAAQGEFLNVYNTMMATLIDASKIYTDEAIRMQDAWMHTINKQMDMGRKMNTSIFEAGRRTAGEAGEMGKQAGEEAAA
ncbi:MAG: hypothetical protein ACYDFU_10455, partial [Nitrospirota bacterium]